MRVVVRDERSLSDKDTRAAERLGHASDRSEHISQNSLRYGRFRSFFRRCSVWRSCATTWMCCDVALQTDARHASAERFDPASVDTRHSTGVFCFIFCVFLWPYSLHQPSVFIDCGVRRRCQGSLRMSCKKRNAPEYNMTR